MAMSQLRLTALTLVLNLVACGGSQTEEQTPDLATSESAAISGDIIGTWYYTSTNNRTTVDDCGCGTITSLSTAPYGCYQLGTKFWYDLVNVPGTTNRWQGKRTVMDCTLADVTIVVNGNVLTEYVYKNGTLTWTYNWNRY
jgi:hypothetical protein